MGRFYSCDRCVLLAGSLREKRRPLKKLSGSALEQLSGVDVDLFLANAHRIS